MKIERLTCFEKYSKGKKAPCGWICFWLYIYSSSSYSSYLRNRGTHRFGTVWMQEVGDRTPKSEFSSWFLICVTLNRLGFTLPVFLYTTKGPVHETPMHSGVVGREDWAAWVSLFGFCDRSPHRGRYCPLTAAQPSVACASLFGAIAVPHDGSPCRPVA